MSDEETWEPPTHKYEREVDHWKSVVLWPKEVELGRRPNISEDQHGTREAAEAVCMAIRRNGLGGEGKHFPLRTWVVPVLKKPHKIITVPSSDDERSDELEEAEDYEAVKKLMDETDTIPSATEFAFATHEELMAFIEGYEHGVGYLGEGYWTRPEENEDDD